MKCKNCEYFRKLSKKDPEYGEGWGLCESPVPFWAELDNRVDSETPSTLCKFFIQRDKIRVSEIRI